MLFIRVTILHLINILQVKSDFLDALSNAEKQVCDYKSKLETLNENFCKAGGLQEEDSIKLYPKFALIKNFAYIDICYTLLCF